ncbi:imidazole glycerol phosphate synthase subunit HisH [Tuberibacillus sp. Marseille-P3662]|uniref:imidazole glycerol phosphate synthase subunit HisH n=1 Tax=Tuberibacillus sp. Marseille-P3662 TaxID=1965358 RepID=UPI000A1C880A|nr:imidazole glycerol phosphate synthase subunit HisH [Tuberibacillus sp. Marseille-P3662]
MIGVLDYGMGNLFSVSAALDRLHIPHLVSPNHDELARTDGLILPGVGSFHDAMAILRDQDHDRFIDEYVRHKPLLGICLGMQLLLETSEENGTTDGLALLPGHVVRFAGFDEQTGHRYKVPHMGWNHIQWHQQDSPLYAETEETYVYFVHSYKAVMAESATCLASADYHGDVPAVIGQGRIFGTQFHPEKSGTLGMTILNNFCSLCL